MATRFFYHSFNFLKFRILSVLVDADSEMTSQDIADRIGIDRKRVSDALYHWHRCHYGYVKRRGKRGKFHLYIIGKHGAEAYVKYKNRYSKGLSLDLRNYSPKKMSSVLDYLGISQEGKESGYSEADLPELAGLQKRNSPQSEILNHN